MTTATIRIPEQKRDILKIIATLEKREMKEIISDLIPVSTNSNAFESYILNLNIF